MTVVAYFDCFSGISGDMLLGALLDAGASLERVRAGLATLPITGYELATRPAEAHGLRGTVARIRLADQRADHRGLPAIEAIIGAGTLPERVRERAQRVFQRLAVAEAQVHGIPMAAVHFHEVGAVDAIVDIVGTALALEDLDVDELYCSELPLTSGRVHSAHGELPVPAPATVELLKGTAARWRPLASQHELVTPTGAAVVAALARFERPALRITHVGHGFGERELPWANCLRVLLGETGESAGAAADEADVIAVLETNVDDMTGEELGWLMERLFAAGALDVTFAPIQMKKQRPATQVTVLASLGRATEFAALLLRESTTLGVRVSEARRHKARRRSERIATPLGEAAVKLKLDGERVVDVSAEYESARALAAGAGLPLRTVIAQVEHAARQQFGLAGPAESGPSGSPPPSGRPTDNEP
ncbi:MAG TPA: nickel pincer cofactor biosynthesis protein LarC [Ktedonobacterales bacterium]|nr:nickel pincer cofactor biosynthesis protein LarC [Ktedonobacterales bacterium]